MYARQMPDGRYRGGVSIPKNYSGNAFREPSMTSEDIDDTPIEEAVKEEVQKAAPAIASVPSHSPLQNLMRGGGIGLEELLILGLVFLISQNDTKDDLTFLLLMLLFIQ